MLHPGVVGAAGTDEEYFAGGVCGRTVRATLPVPTGDPRPSRAGRLPRPPAAGRQDRGPPGEILRDALTADD